MNKLISYIILSLLFLVSCSNRQKYWDIKHFTFDNSILSDGEKVKMVYTSRGPEGYSEISHLDNNQEEIISLKYSTNFHIHLVAITNTNDTVNILTNIENDFNENDFDKDFVFYSLSYNEYCFGFDLVPHICDELKKSYSKVTRDPEYDFIADNDFPTIYGRVERINE